MSSPRTSALTSGNACSASTDALTKKDIRPSRTPCFFWNVSPYDDRRFLTADILISLNVVSSAASWPACTRRFAIVRRHRLMWTTCSMRSFVAGRRIGSGVAAVAGVAGAGVGGAVPVTARDAAAGVVGDAGTGAAAAAGADAAGVAGAGAG